MSAPGEQPSEDALELSNEFARVVVRKVETRNGVRLQISAPHIGREILLCPLELESLTWQTHETFSDLIANRDE